MLGILLATALCVFAAWYFLVRKASPSRNDFVTDESAKRRGKGDQKTKDSQNKGQDSGKTASSAQDTASKTDKVTEKKSKTHADHQFFFKSFKYNDGVIQDIDFSNDAEWMLTSSHNRQHLLTNMKSETSLKFTSNTIPHAAAVSQKGKYVALLLETKVAIFQKQTADVRTGVVFNGAQDVALGAMIVEDIDTVVVAGGGSHCNFNIYSTQGALIKTIRGDISDALDVVFNKNTLRAVYLSKSTTDLRIFRLQTTSKGEFKDFAKEHTLCGHTTGVMSVSFDASGTRLFSLSINKIVKVWDLRPEGFKDIHIKCVSTVDLAQVLPQLNQHDIDQAATKLQWLGTTASSTPEADETHILAVAQSASVWILQLQGNSCTLRDTISHPHGDDFLNKLHYIFDSKNPNKGVLITQGQRRVFGWKVRY